MIDFATYRKHLEDKLAAIRKQAEESLKPKSLDDTCDHDWRRYRQAIQPDRKYKQPPFTGKGAYLIVKGCAKCKSKRLMDMVVER